MDEVIPLHRYSLPRSVQQALLKPVEMKSQITSGAGNAAWLCASRIETLH